MKHSQLTISRSNLLHNYNFFRSKLFKSTKMLVMVKANAYGHGDVECSQLLEEFGADYLGVALPGEGIKLKKYGINLPIIILTPGIDNFQEIFEYNLEPSITDPEALISLEETINKLNISRCKIHIKMDSGMNRFGFTFKETDMIAGFINRNPNAEVVSFFSHLAAADNPRHDAFTLEQITLFSLMCDDIQKKIPYKPFRHILNSVGTERFSSAQMDMVRIGVGMYGTSYVDETKLKPVAYLQAPLIHINRVSGGTVGYGRHGTVGENGSVIGIIPLGYADGADRHLGRGAASFMLNGKRVPTIGNICMDSTLLDITGVSAKVGDLVTLFGEEPTASEIAGILKTITYEIFTSVHPRVVRVVGP